MAAYQQIGNFEVVSVNGKQKKQGGNVVSYFCTPEGRVVHFVLGPASPKKLLAEAEWAVATWTQAKDAADSLSRQTAALREAHQSRLGQKGTDKKAHQFLAGRPFPLLSQIYLTVFEDLLNQEVSQAGPYVAQAARNFQKARDLNRPVVLFLYRDEGKNAGKRYSQFLAQPVVAQALSRCVLVAMPLEELPALSSMLDIPSYQVPAKTNPVIVIAGPSGEQLDAVAGLKEPQEFARRVGLAIGQLRAARAGGADGFAGIRTAVAR